MSSDHTVDAVVVGAGVVGLAVARALARSGREVLVLERESTIGSHTSSRSSEVIHAGIYYTPGSLKARLCVAGRRALYEYARNHEVEHRRIGKLIVATDESELVTLDGYHSRALANGVEGLSWLDGAGVQDLEPELRCIRALASAETGIIDVHGFMTALRCDAEADGAETVTRTVVRSGRIDDDGFELVVMSPDVDTVRCSVLVNSAGLWAQELARTLWGFPSSLVPACHYAKGQYFTLPGRSPFRRLVYPVSANGGLGIHVTLDLAGHARFGPDVTWVGEVEYSVDETRRPHFEEAIRRYWPALPSDTLQSGYAGIRPKLGPATAGPQDFVIQGPSVHGVPGLINLFGIESPGMTAALAIAEHVMTQLQTFHGGVPEAHSSSSSALSRT